MLTEKCETCDRKFATRRGLNIHMRVHTSNTDSVKCNHCDKTCKSEGGLKIHMRFKHRDLIEIIKYDFKCDQCDKTCKSKGGLTLHKKIHVVYGKYLMKLNKMRLGLNNKR